MEWIISLLRSDGSIIINKRLAHNIGLNETIMYSELLSKYKYFSDKKQLQEDGFFFNTVIDMKKDTTLSDYQQRIAIKNLIKLGLIKYKTKGLPAKRYFKIIQDEKIIKKHLINRDKNLISSYGKTKELDTEKLQCNNTNINDTNCNNTKVKVNVAEFSNENIRTPSINNFKNNISKINNVLSTLNGSLSIHYKTNDCRDVLIYYIKKYTETFNKIHPELKSEHWEKIINDLFVSPVCELVDGDIRCYYEMIDKHFSIQYENCDYNILHFVTNGILENRFYDVCY